MQMREKVGKSRNTVFFQWFVAPEGRKVGLLKRRVRLARWEMKNCTPLWREAHFQVKMYKTHHGRTALEVAMSEKCTPLWREAHFHVKMKKKQGFGPVLEVQMSKSERRCGAEHISMSKCTKMVGPLLDVEMSKICTPLWREAHFHIKMFKKTRGSDHFWRFRCRKVHTVVARSTFRSQHVKNTRVRTTFGGSDIASLRFTRLHYITLHYTTLHYTPQHHNYDYTTTFHYTPLH